MSVTWRTTVRGLEEVGRSLGRYCSIPGRKWKWLGIGRHEFRYSLEVESTRFAEGPNVASKRKTGTKAISQIPGHLQRWGRLREEWVLVVGAGGWDQRFLFGHAKKKKFPWDTKGKMFCRDNWINDTVSNLGLSWFICYQSINYTKILGARWDYVRGVFRGEREEVLRASPGVRERTLQSLGHRQPPGQEGSQRWRCLRIRSRECFAKELCAHTGTCERSSQRAQNSVRWIWPQDREVTADHEESRFSVSGVMGPRPGWHRWKNGRGKRKALQTTWGRL